MHITVNYHEEIDEHEFVMLANGSKVMARDVENTVPRNAPPEYQLRPMLLWNGRNRNIKKIKGKWYLITPLLGGVHG